MNSLDAQAIEILGRNRLVNELVSDGVEVALPLRDRGVDLIAYVELASTCSQFMAVPIQMKAASDRAFSIDSKYQKISNLLMVYVWGLRSFDNAETFALTYPEALRVAEEMKWTETASWAKGTYSTSSPSTSLRALLLPFKISSGGWFNKISSVSALAVK